MIPRRTASGVIPVALAVAALFAAAAGAVATPLVDTLFLKDNSVRIGKIVAQDSAYTTIKTQGDMLVISASEILRIGHERPRDLLLPSFMIGINGGLASPAKFYYPDGVGLRVGVRYMVNKWFGVGAALTYGAWQNNFDTTVQGSGGVKDPQVLTKTFQISATSPRLGIFAVAPISSSARFLLGVDVGQTYFVASPPDSQAVSQPSFSFAVRGDLRFGLTDQVGLLLGVQYEGYKTSFNALENFRVTTGNDRSIGDVLISGGVDIGF